MSGSVALRVVVSLAFAFIAACSTCKEKEQPQVVRGRPDVVIVSIDALRADRLGAYGYRIGTSPGLDAFAEESVVFDAHHSQAPATLPSHASLFTGLDPDHNGVLSNGFYRLGAGATTLAELLSGAGYRTGAVVASSVLSKEFGLDQGFASYDARFEASHRMPRIDAKTVTDRAVAWLDQRSSDESVLLFLHYFDTHKPNVAPSRFAFADRYDSDVAYVDEQLSRLFAELKRRGRYEGALVFVTADHGQSLGEHHLSGHTGILYEQTLHIPLIVHFPGGAERGLRVAALTRSVDVMPTALAAAGIAAPAGIDGIDLSGLARGEPERTPRESFALARIEILPQLDQVSLISGRWKLVSKTAFEPMDDQPLVEFPVQRPGSRIPAVLPDALVERVRRKAHEIAAGSPDVRQLFVLEADPAEERNVYGAYPEVARELEAKVEGRIRAKPGAPGGQCPLDDQIEEQLRALGYVF
ncbi:MAG: sulfatase-like hydrolase/transferase [Proteobacteria bacterium]|jgi:arylsulfatase A-like enzyme|nr:sulfatase-like hydrolase/transferase [Pseudomonadota bacterium]